MKTRGAIDHSKPLMLLGALLALPLSCGPDGPRYDDKDYGQEPSLDAEPQIRSLEQPASSNPYVALPLPTPPPLRAPPLTREPDSTPAPTPAPTPTPDPTFEDEEDDGEVTLDPATVILSNHFRAVFDVDSALGIRDGVGFRSLGLVASQVHDSLTTTAADGMTVDQQFGDGISRSTGSQAVVSTAGDANRLPGEPTTSGLYTLDRIVTAACPSVFLCIERLRFHPVDGAGQTVCFRDPVTGDRVPFPYGALPNYQASDFTAHLGAYGPFEASVFAGDDVDCDSPNAAPRVVESVVLNVTAESAAGIPFYLHTVQPIPAQYVIGLEITRESGDMVSPYLDETAMLNMKSRYVLNEDLGQIVKIIVTTRQSVDIAQQVGGGLLGRLTGAIINLDGVVADLHFELCRDLLDPSAVDHCGAGQGP